MMNSVFNYFCYFLIENVLVPRKSHVKGLHVQTEFLPVVDNRTWVWCTLIAVNNSNDDNNKRYKRSVSKEKGNVEPWLVKCFNLISFRYTFKREKYPQPQQNSTKPWKITKILSCKTSFFKHCYQDEARKVVGHDGLCTHRKARTALTRKKTNSRCTSRKNPKRLPTCLPTTLHSTFRVHRRLYPGAPNERC